MGILLDDIDFDKLAEYIQQFLKTNSSNNGSMSIYDMRMVINTWLVAASGQYAEYPELREAAENLDYSLSGACVDVLVNMGIFRIKNDNEGGFSNWFVCEWD